MPPREPVKLTGHQLLPGARFAHHQNRHVRGGHSLHEPEGLCHARVLGDDVDFLGTAPDHGLQAGRPGVKAPGLGGLPDVPAVVLTAMRPVENDTGRPSSLP